MSGYEDIIHLPHPTSPRHPRMSMLDRAAQFSPFAALTGYESEVKEVARLTESKIELCEDQKTFLDARLRILEDSLPQHPEVTIVYFLPDKRKSGGAYVTVSGIIKKFDHIEERIIFRDGTVIPIDAVLQVDSCCLPENI